MKDAVYNLSRSALLAASWATGNWDNLPWAMDDRLHQPFRARLFPGGEAILEEVRGIPQCSGVAISGSGPSVLAFSRGEAHRVAELMCSIFTRSGVRSRFFVLSEDSAGVTVAKNVSGTDIFRPLRKGSVFPMAFGVDGSGRCVVEEVISDSDVRLRPDYLKTVVAPLADPAVGYVCTLYKTAGAGNLYEKLELLTLNAELIPSMVFARVTGAARFLIGASVALRRSVLEASGGLAPLADCLVEDNEMGRRIRATGRRGELLPYVIDTVPDLGGFARWWHHQGHWDQCNRAANPWGYLAAGVVRGVPFALLFALARGFDPFGLSVLGGALAVRLAAAAGTLAIGLGDREGLRSLWLLPLRDLAGFVSWILAYVRRTTVWRGRRFTLTRGRLRP